MGRLWVGILLVTALALQAGVSVAQDATLLRARQLIDTKQFRQAYELLEPLEQQRAGNPDFDYLLGIAAIDAGERTRGIFALERVLAVKPDHPQARAEIARAYFLIGENRVAREEFEAVKKTRPPEEVAASVNRFLDAIEARELSAGTGVAGYLEATFGTDNTVNAATGSNQFAIPLIPGLIFNLAAGATRQSDTYTSLAGGVFGRYALDRKFSLIGNFTFDARHNSKRDTFDTGSIDATGGLNVKVDDNNEVLVAGQVQSFSVDNSRFRDAVGGVAQWKHALTPKDQLTAYGQFTRLDYPTAGSRNADRTVLGGAWAHNYGDARNSVSYFGLYGGEERTRSQGFPHFGHRLAGARLGGQIDLAEKWTLNASASVEDRRYGGPDPLFLVNRRDKQFDFRVAAPWAITREWTVTPQFSYTDNRANIIVNEHDRKVLSVAVRYDFR